MKTNVSPAKGDNNLVAYVACAGAAAGKQELQSLNPALLWLKQVSSAVNVRAAAVVSAIVSRFVSRML